MHRVELPFRSARLPWTAPVAAGSARGRNPSRPVGAALLLAILGQTLGCGAASTRPPAASTGPAAATAPRPSPDITGSEARALVARGAVLLDVTPHSRADQSFIEGRTVIPYDELAERHVELPRDRVIVVYCRSGRASPDSARLLRSRGYEVRLLGARADWDR